MNTILWSRAGRGGRDALLENLLEKTARGERCLWLVPEPYSHAAERLLAERGGAPVCLYASVITFRRMCDNILSESGGLAVPVLDEGGRLLLMRRALNTAISRLKTPFAYNPALLPGLIQTLDECKSYGITPGDLERAGGDKLCDLALIFSIYDMLCEGGPIDPRDRVMLAWERARNAGFFDGAHIYVSDFISFTPQERLLLKRLADSAASFTLLFCGEFGGRGFEPLHETIRKLKINSEHLTIDNAEEGRDPALLHMEKYWFERKPPSYAGNGAIEIYSASGESEEVQGAAERIIGLVRDEGARWREIGVVCSDLEAYGTLIESIFPQYGIPIFSDKMDEMSDKPLFRCIRALNDCLQYGFRADDVMRLLRTGLLPFPHADADLMENYLRRWNMRGSRFSGNSDWSRPLSGWHNEPTETELSELQRLNTLRRHISSGVKALTGGKTAQDCGKALLIALEKLGVPEKISERTETLLEAGEAKLANECGQMWELLIKGVEQCAGILGEEPMDCHEFFELCLLVLSGYTVGSIPASLDRVHVGDQGRFPRLPLPILIYIGLSPDKVPARPGPGGMLSAEERSALAEAGCEMPPDPPSKIEREFYNLYTACTLPSKKLILTYSQPQKSDGNAEIIDKLCKIFNLRPIPVPPPTLPKTPFHVSRLPLSGKSVSALYGKTLHLSASKMETFSLCPFSYLCRYGLNAKARPEPGFTPLDVGQELHSILESCARYAMECGGFACLAREEILSFAEKGAKASLEKVLRHGNVATPRLLAQGERLARTAMLLAGKLWDEFFESKFSPIGFELFVEGKEIPLDRLPQDAPSSYRLRGIADRVDGYRKEDVLYLRVVDYKTGKKTFRINDVYNGLSAQMPLYLFLLCDSAPRQFFEGDGTLGSGAILPAGMLYVQTRELLLSPDAKHSGLLLDDTEILDAMDGRLRGGGGVLPVFFNRDGSFSKRSSVVSSDELEQLKKQVGNLVRDTAQGIAEGKMEAAPLELRDSPCDGWEYRAACLFDEETDEKRLYIIGGE